MIRRVVVALTIGTTVALQSGCGEPYADIPRRGMVRDEVMVELFRSGDCVGGTEFLESWPDPERGVDWYHYRSQIHLTCGEGELQSPEHAAAHEILDKGLKRYPDSSRLRFSKALVYDSLGDKASARKLYEEAEEVARKNIAARGPNFEDDLVLTQLKGRPAADTLKRSVQASTPRYLRSFEPGQDKEATQMLFGSASDHGSLARHYRSLGFEAMANAVATAEKAKRAEVMWDWMHEGPKRHDQLWSCPDTDDERVTEAVRGIDAAIDASDFLAARAIGEKALQRSGPACPLLLETSLAILGAASTGAAVDDEDVELAFRTLVTADLEMGLQVTAAPPEWPYQIATHAFARHGADAMAFVSAGMAVRRMEMRESLGQPATPAGEKAIRELFLAATKRMRQH